MSTKGKRSASKTYVVLRMYDEFRTGGRTSVAKCRSAYGLSAPTVHRYLALLRAYFMENYGKDIVYDAAKGTYRLLDPKNF